MKEFQKEEIQRGLLKDRLSLPHIHHRMWE